MIGGICPLSRTMSDIPVGPFTIHSPHIVEFDSRACCVFLLSTVTYERLLDILGHSL